MTPNSISSSAASPPDRAALTRRLLAERERRRNRAVSRFARYQSDPIAFVENELLGFLWSKQKEIASSVVENRRTAVKSCHGAGKSALAARIGAWWLSVHSPGEAFLVTSAPTFTQVRNILWREVNKVHAAGSLPGQLNQTEWWFGNEIVGFGRSPADTDPTAFQGIHARRVLVIFDEACGIASALWDAADSLISNDDSRFLAIGNPDDPATRFAEVCKPGSGWKTIRVNALESPNLSGEVVPDWIRPLLVGKVWVEEKRKSWGEASPLWISKVTGEFPEQATDGLVPIGQLRLAIERTLDPTDPNELGVDVARFGDDSTVIFHRRGAVARRVAREKNRDLMHVTGMVVKLQRETGATRVKIDDAGLGGGVTDRLREMQRTNEFPTLCEVVAVNVGERATTEADAEKFANLRAQINWAMRERIIAGELDLDDMADEAVAQAGAMKYKLTSSGKIQIEAKAEMKKRGLPSPDDWDALVLAFANPISTYDSSMSWV